MSLLPTEEERIRQDEAERILRYLRRVAPEIGRAYGPLCHVGINLAADAIAAGQHHQPWPEPTEGGPDVAR